MTGAERIDLGEMRREVRDGFNSLGVAIRKVEDRVVSLETTRAVQEELEAARAERRLSRNGKAAMAFGAAGTIYGLISLLHGLNII